jgi:hypothetical protein
VQVVPIQVAAEAVLELVPDYPVVLADQDW